MEQKNVIEVRLNNLTKDIIYFDDFNELFSFENLELIEVLLIDSFNVIVLPDNLNKLKNLKIFSASYIIYQNHLVN